jgi:hypothetical protein
MDLNFVNFNIKICECKTDISNNLIGKLKKIKLKKDYNNHNNFYKINEEDKLLYNEFFNQLNPYFDKVVKGYGFNKFKLLSYWQQKYNKKENHDLHCHSVDNQEFSFVYYLDCSEKSSFTTFFVPGYPYVNGNNKINIKPEIKKLVVFPSYIPHLVYPNQDNKRQIISGNISYE